MDHTQRASINYRGPKIENPPNTTRPFVCLFKPQRGAYRIGVATRSHLIATSDFYLKIKPSNEPGGRHPKADLTNIRPPIHQTSSLKSASFWTFSFAHDSVATFDKQHESSIPEIINELGSKRLSTNFIIRLHSFTLPDKKHRQTGFPSQS